MGFDQPLKIKIKEERIRFLSSGEHSHKVAKPFEKKKTRNDERHVEHTACTICIYIYKGLG